jgi:GNAT superfamily N-acetyltransferase
LIKLAAYELNGIVDSARFLDGYGGTETEARETFEQILSILTKQPRMAPWGTYFAVFDDDRIAGLCSFKSDPRNDRVEIAYGTLPTYEGMGIAKAMASALVAIATCHGVAPFAHTAPIEGASASVLRATGFFRVGETIDPDDGLVWRWELSR